MDAPGMFGASGWQYLVIPEGTVIPSGLVVTRDHVMRIRGRSCWHYSISPNYSMPVSQYLLLLDQLAANAKIDLKRASHG
jgi:Tse2 ADP-ribosyltransferase toxins